MPNSNILIGYIHSTEICVVTCPRGTVSLCHCAFVAMQLFNTLKTSVVHKLSNYLNYLINSTILTISTF